MGAKKQVKRARKQVERLEQIVAIATAETEQRIGALDELLRQSADEAERHRAVVERAAELATSTGLDLEARARQQAAALDRQSEAAMAHMEAIGRAAELRVTVEIDTVVNELRCDSETRLNEVVEAADAALQRLGERLQQIEQDGAVRLDELEREILRRLTEPATNDGPDRGDPGPAATDATLPVEPGPVPISVSFTGVTELPATPGDDPGSLLPFATDDPFAVDAEHETGNVFDDLRGLPPIDTDTPFGTGDPYDQLNELAPTDTVTASATVLPSDAPSDMANPHAPEHLLPAGSQVRAPHLRAAVAANPSTPARQLQLLARDPDPEVRAAVADNPGAPNNARRRARRQSSRATRSPRRDADPGAPTSEDELVTPLT